MFKISHAHQDRTTCENIMRQIYDEQPSFWPYGLSAQHFDGGLWLVKKSSDENPVGFVGWQLRKEAGQKVGYYSVGILPEWRRNGMAKEAVTKLLAKQAADVDVVRALIDHRNQPSRNLAKSLESPVPLQVKLAALPKWLLPAAASLTGGAVNSAFWDQYMDPSRKFSESMPWNIPNMDKGRGMTYALNTLIGMLGGAGIGIGGRMLKTDPIKGTALANAGLSGILLSPTKDLVATSLQLPGKASEILDVLKRNLNKPDPAPEPKLDPRIIAALGGAGAVGLGGMALAGLRGSGALSNIAAKNRSGTVRVTLPTKKPGDTETQIEMPMEDVELSNNLYRALGRDTRRRLRSESTERKRKFLGEQQNAKNLGINMNDDAEILNESQPV